MDGLSALIDAGMSVERLRVQLQTRLTHLKKQGRMDKDAEDLFMKTVELEKYVDKKVAKNLKDHPAYDWFSRVRGVGDENIGKVIYSIRIKPDVDAPDAPYADTISALWKYAGYSVENGKAPKKTKGEKLSYNSQLRSMCWRLGGSLIKSKGKFYEYYISQKDRYTQRFTNEGIMIVPAIKIPKENAEQYISEGHIHNMALRKMIKLFLSCLWLAWREAEGLPTTSPYAIEQLKHNSYISPGQMVDKEPKKNRTVKND